MTGRDTQSWFVLVIKGMAMGAADLVPGVSGGTVAFIAGIYEELLETLGNLGLGVIHSLFAEGPMRTWRRYNLGFLAAIVGGIGFSVVLLASGLHHLLLHHPVPLWAFFFGLVAASTPFMLKDIQWKEWNFLTVLILLMGAAAAWILTGLPPLIRGDHPAFLFGAGAIAICAMILPGISGSFILVLLGAYTTVIGALKSFDIVRIGSFACGALAGLLGFSKALAWVFRHHRQWAVALLSGFLIGSLRKLWPWKANIRPLFTHSDGRVEYFQANVLPWKHMDPQLGLSLACMVAGAIFVMVLGAIAARGKRETT